MKTLEVGNLNSMKELGACSRIWKSVVDVAIDWQGYVISTGKQYTIKNLSIYVLNIWV